MSYMVEGQGTTTYSKSKRWLYCYASESKRLLQRITDTVVEYLVLQVSAGAQVMLVHCFKNYQHFTFHFFVHDKQHSFACYNFCTMVHTHPFNGRFSGTIWVSCYQKGKTNLDFTEAVSQYAIQSCCFMYTDAAAV